MVIGILSFGGHYRKFDILPPEDTIQGSPCNKQLIGAVKKFSCNFIYCHHSHIGKLQPEK